MIEKKQPINVLSWARTARIGEKIVYATRHSVYSPASPARSMDSAMEAHDAGLVFLAQREDCGSYKYEATRISSQVARILGINPNRKIGDSRL